MDSERRPLRPIGANAADIAARTARLLTRLTGRPGVHLFSGVPIVAGQTPITHAISAGRLVLLVESVAWPAGTYSTTPEGGVLCDGEYIGQSVRPLLGAVRQLRQTLPADFRIGAIVVVHPSLPEEPTLPDGGPAELRWLRPTNLTPHLAERLRRAHYCQSDINTVTLSWPPVTPGL